MEERRTEDPVFLQERKYYGRRTSGTELRTQTQTELYDDCQSSQSWGHEALWVMRAVSSWNIMLDKFSSWILFCLICGLRNCFLFLLIENHNSVKCLPVEYPRWIRIEAEKGTNTHHSIGGTLLMLDSLRLHRRNFLLAIEQHTLRLSALY